MAQKDHIKQHILYFFKYTLISRLRIEEIFVDLFFKSYFELLQLLLSFGFGPMMRDSSLVATSRFSFLLGQDHINEAKRKYI
jgi:hypothetical protein